MNDGRTIGMRIDEIRAKIKSILDTYLENADWEQVSDDADLTEWGMDSKAFIQVIVDIETQFDIEIPDDYLLMEKMNTINKIADIIYSLINESMA